MKVYVIEKATGEKVEQIDCATEQEAYEVARGIRINLDHNEYRVEVRE